MPRRPERDEPPPLVDDGLPTLPSGEPVLARWFVLLMLVLVPAAIGVSAWALLSIDDDPLPPAERRVPGDATMTYARGQAVQAETSETEPGPDCAQHVDLYGDEAARQATADAVAAACEALAVDELAEARDGLRELDGGQLRIAAFERSGLESTTRMVDGAPVVELNAKFQFDDARRAAPVVVHELTLLGRERFPGRPVSAADVLAATEAQQVACQRLGLDEGERVPRGCRDAADLLAEPDPLGALVEAGFPGGAGDSDG